MYSFLSIMTLPGSAVRMGVFHNTYVIVGCDTLESRQNRQPVQTRHSSALGLNIFVRVGTQALLKRVRKDYSPRA